MAASLGPELGLVLDTGLGLEDSWSSATFSLGLGADVDGLAVREELDLPVGSLGMSPEPRLGLDDLGLGAEAGTGLGVDEALGFGDDVAPAGLEPGLEPVGLRLLLLSRSLRWLLYEVRLGSLYRSTVRTFPYVEG